MILLRSRGCRRQASQTSTRSGSLGFWSLGFRVRVQGLGFRVWGFWSLGFGLLEFRVRGLGFLEFRVWGLGFKVQGLGLLGFRVEKLMQLVGSGLGFRVLEFRVEVQVLGCRSLGVLDVGFTAEVQVLGFRAWVQGLIEGSAQLPVVFRRLPQHSFTML